METNLTAHTTDFYNIQILGYIHFRSTGVIPMCSQSCVFWIDSCWL